MESINAALCTLCGKECDPCFDYHSIVQCGIANCYKSTYHTECLGMFLRRRGMDTQKMTGYPCPVGSGKAACKVCHGQAAATYRRIPSGGRKKPAPSALLPANTKPQPKPQPPKPQPQPQAGSKKKSNKPKALPVVAVPAAGQGVASRMGIVASISAPVPGMAPSRPKPRKRSSGSRSKLQSQSNGQGQGQGQAQARPITDVNMYNALLAAYGVPLADIDSDIDNDSDCESPAGSSTSTSTTQSLDSDPQDDGIRFPTDEELFELLGCTF